MSVRANIIINQGSTFNAQLLLNDPYGAPINVSDYNVAAQVRRNYTSINAVSFNTSGNSSGYIEMNMNANTTQSLAVGRYVYDVVLTDGGGSKVRIMEGQVTISGGVTR